MGSFPAQGSRAEVNDFEILLSYQKARTRADCAVARSEVTQGFMTFFAGKYGPLTYAEGKKIYPQISKIYAPYYQNAFKAKNIFKRKRPYYSNNQIIPCIKKESSYAYPSKHATMAHAYAVVLIKLFPTRAAAIKKRAEDIGLNRVIGGVHHPSDIVAGKKLGVYIGNLMLKRIQSSDE